MDKKDKYLRQFDDFSVSLKFSLIMYVKNSSVTEWGSVNKVCYY